MHAVTKWILLGGYLVATGCAGGDAEDTAGSAAPDVSGETTPPPVPLPPETEPAATSSDTVSANATTP